MSEWATAESSPGYRTKTIQYGSCTIIVERPILTETEQTKREAQVKATVERALRDYITRKEHNQ